MSLYSGKRLHAYKWKKLPIDKAVIDRVHELGTNDHQLLNAQSELLFEWNPGFPLDDVQGAPEPMTHSHNDEPHSVEASNHESNTIHESNEPNDTTNNETMINNDNPILEHENENSDHDIENNESNVVSSDINDIENDESEEPVTVPDYTHEDLVYNNSYTTLEENIESDTTLEPESVATTIEAEHVPPETSVEEVRNEAHERSDTDLPPLR